MGPSSRTRGLLDGPADGQDDRCHLLEDHEGGRECREEEAVEEEEEELEDSRQRLLPAVGTSCRLVLDSGDCRAACTGSGNTGLVRGREEPDSRRRSATAGLGPQTHATKQTNRTALSDMLLIGGDSVGIAAGKSTPRSTLSNHRTALIRRQRHADAGHEPHGRPCTPAQHRLQRPRQRSHSCTTHNSSPVQTICRRHSSDGSASNDDDG